jgi:[1-hydroxy-2-(trimethylamino)ethyl]phosphonate dioxygenase
MSQAQSPTQPAADRNIAWPTVAQEIVRLLNEHGESQYGGEAVTQREHALQCASLAEHDGASPALIAAALIHDIGHLLHALPSNAPEAGIDDQHELLAAQWLSLHFGKSVVEPVRLHVAAKRFLCATDPVYFGQLSQPSKLSLSLQGGPMSPAEVSEFLSNPFSRDAIKLRRWDDAAKIAGLKTPTPETFASAIEHALKESPTCPD